MNPYLFFVLLPMVGLVVREALLDRTPRRPFDWTRPGLAWWAAKRTPREQARTAIALGSEKSS